MRPATQYNALINRAQQECKEALAGLGDGENGERLEQMYNRVHYTLEQMKLPESGTSTP